MLANNVVGTVQPVTEVASECGSGGVPLLCDAVQAVGKIPVHVQELGVDYLSLGAHKFYGPLGAAALWVRQGAEFSPLLVGGAQERRRRAGNVNVPAVVGMGRAAELAVAELRERQIVTAALRDRFESGLRSIPDVVIHGQGAARLANTSHVAFTGADSQALLIRLDLEGFAVSAGAACSSGTVEPSETLLAMGVSGEEALSALRISFGQGNTIEEVDAFLAVLTRQVEELRQAASTGYADSALQTGMPDAG
jgi:cysteine desulfurase